MIHRDDIQPKSSEQTLHRPPQPFSPPTCLIDMRDLRLALRTLIRTPFVTGIAVMSLALGIGANAAIYSTTHRMLLAALPVPEPSRAGNLNGSRPTPRVDRKNAAEGK